MNVTWRWRAVQPWCAHPASTSASAGRARCPQTADPSRSLRRRTGSALPRVPACWCWPGCRGRAALGYPVLALIRGSALGQDGASNVLSAPSGPAQQRVIRQALVDADLTAGDVDVVEAHGTGTRVGDPIEAKALQATYGKAHSAARPLLVGSVKSNIGHAQYAAGVAGMIKAVQSIRHGVVPATVHLDSPTPQVDWSSGTIEVVSRACPWPDQTDRPRRAGVSAFGISGTNAHVILEQAPPELATAKPARKRPPVMPWVLSAKSASALAAQAARLRRFVEQHSDLDPHDVAYSLVTTRASFDHRAVAVGAERDELLSGLAAIASCAPAPNVVTGKAAATGGTVFVFPGQGSQWTGMAVELLDSAPAFADQMRLCDAAFAEFVDWSLLEAVRGGVGSPEPRPGRCGAARAVRGDGVAGRAMAGAGNPAGRRPRPFAGRDRCRLRRRRPLVARRGEGGHVA